ncbi:MAG: ABC transporter substrate-binding protein [Thermomicrobiaceae bacterium]
MRDPRELAQLLQAAPMSRRHLLQRAALLGVSAPIFGSLLAACGGDDEEDDTEDEAADETEDEEEPAAEEEETEDDAAEDTEDEEETEEEEPEEAEDDEEGDDEAAEGEGQQGGRLVLMGHHPLESLHPDDDGPTVTWTGINAIHEPLIGVNYAFEVQMVLATDYEISDDGLTYTLSLREDVVFHDGEPFTAEDVVFAYNWFMDEENAAITSADFVSVDSVEAADDLTVTVNMVEADASFLRGGLNATIFASHHHEELGYEGYSADPIGTGPFQLVEWNPDDATLVAAFEDHWDGRPYLDEIEIRVIPEGSVRVLELESGNADSSIWMVGVEDAVRMHEEADQLGITSYKTSSTACNHFPMNNTRDQFSEVEVRRAMMHAIDRDQVINAVFAGAAVKATANLAPSLSEWYEPDVTEYEFDVEGAQQMLEDAGWTLNDDGIREKDGVTLEWECIVLTGDEARRPEAEMVTEMLSQVGINMEITENPQGSTPMREGTADMALYNWTYGGSNGEPDARVTLHSDGGNNFSHYSNPDMDELLVQGVQESDPAARAEIYSEVQKLFAEDVPFIYMMYWDWFNQWSQRVQGLPAPDEVLSGSNLYDNTMLRQIWIQE